MKYLLSSAFLMIGSQLGQPWSMGCAWVWLIPLIYRSFQQPLSFKDGIIWGIIVFGFHLSWLCVMLISFSGVRGLLVWILVYAWFVISCGMWLWLTRYSWIGATTLFFLFLTRWSLFACGVLEGYPLIHPLLSLAVYPEILWIIRWIGDLGAFVVLVVCAWLIAKFFHQKRKLFLLLAACCLLPFAFGPVVYQQKKIPAKNMICLQPWWYGCKNPMYVLYRMAHDISVAHHQEPEKKIIVFPESTFCFDIHEYEHALSIWCEGIEDVTIIFGCHRFENNVCGNCVMIIRDGKIQQIYDKQHFMPFVERVPKLFDVIALGSLFIKQQGAMSWLHNTQDIVQLEDVEYQVFICSELFFESKKVQQKPVLFLWNDSWLIFDWTKRLAGLWINYFSVKHDVAILHISTQGRGNI